MSTLKQKAQSILNEKDAKIKPENIKKTVQVFDVVGTLDGIDTSDATATANDLVRNATAYVKGVKISGSIRDYRSESGITDFEDLEYSEDEPSQGKLKLLTHMGLSSPDTVISSDNIVELKIPYYELTTNLGLTADKLKKGVTILGVTGALDAQGIDTSDATATANDLVVGTTAYVNGVKLTGRITDRRTAQDIVNLNVTHIKDNSSTELWVDATPVLENSNTYAYVVNEHSTMEAIVQYSDIASEIDLTPDKIRLGETVLGVVGTYSGLDIVYLEPGDEIHINMKGLEDALETLVDKGGFGAEPLAYDENGEDLFTLKLMSCINMGQPYNHSGIGLVMDGTTTYLKVYNWDATTDTNAVQFSSFIDLVSGGYPAALDFNMNSLLSIMNDLGGHAATDLTFTYPSNAPIIPLIKSNSVGLLTKDGCDIGDVLTFNLANSYITIHKACA